MTPEVRYFTSHDGWRIAYSLYGSGPPLFLVSHAVGSHHLTRTWEQPALREQYEALGKGRTLLRWDARGCGLSQRGLKGWTRRELAKDIEAALDAANVETCDLVVEEWIYPAVLEFIVESPNRVGQLVLLNPTVAVGNPPGRKESFEVLRSADWRAFRETIIQLADAFQPEESRQIAAFNEACLDLADYEVINRGGRQMAVADLLARIEKPTLVVSTNRPAHSLYGVEQGPSAVAAAIKNSRFVVGSGGPPFSLFARPGDWLETVCNFVNESSQAPVPRPSDAILTARETEILALVAAGKTNHEIAEALVVSDATVATHVHNILSKLGVSNRVEAATWWTTHRSS